MTLQQKPSQAFNISLWIAQILIAVTLTWSGSIKLFQPVAQLAAMWPWAGEVPEALLRFTGVVDLLGAFGLILPWLLRIQPKLTPIAALGIIVLMIIASIFHIARGEASNIGFNIVFAAHSGFIAWGRFHAPKPLEGLKSSRCSDL